MNQTKVRSLSLFLMELIISILFFSVAAAFCVQFIVKSHTISGNAENLGNASVNCSSVAELIYASDSPEEIADGVAAAWPEADISAGSSTDICIYFDSDWEPCGAGEAAFALKADIACEDNMMEGGISAVTVQDAKLIYSLDIKHYVQKEVSK